MNKICCWAENYTTLRFYYSSKPVFRWLKAEYQVKAFIFHLCHFLLERSRSASAPGVGALSERRSRWLARSAVGAPLRVAAPERVWSAAPGGGRSANTLFRIFFSFARLLVFYFTESEIHNIFIHMLFTECINTTWKYVLLEIRFILHSFCEILKEIRYNLKQVFQSEILAWKI